MADIPDGASATDYRSILFSEFLDGLLAAVDGRDCVLSGLNCTQQGTPDMTVAVAKGSVLTNGVLKPVTAGNVTISAAHATLKRIDLIVVDSTGAKQVRAGTAAAAPKPPARTANDVVIRAVYVDNAVTTIVTADLATDLRMTRTVGPIVVDKVTTPVVFNTTLAIQTYYSLVVPSGLFLAGKVLRVQMGGSWLSNSGAPTWTLTISYGGTVLFADTTGTTTADVDRGAWNLAFTIVAQGNSDQRIQGSLGIAPFGARTAPTTGESGDLSNLSGISQLSGNAAVDSDAADRTLTVEWTMSVSNVNVETTMEGAVTVLE